MDTKGITLTKTDRKILESYKVMLDGLAEYLGSSYEIVLHSLENLEKSVVKIMNGYHTGRKEGAPITDLALSMLSKIESAENKSAASYFVKNSKGEPMKSSTIIIRGENGRPIGLLCINFYLNTPISSWLGTLVPTEERAYPLLVNENFPETVSELVLKSLERVRLQVESDGTILPSLKNKRIIEMLSDMGIFQMKDAVAIVAQAMNISKNTVYLHLRNINA